MFDNILLVRYDVGAGGENFAAFLNRILTDKWVGQNNVNNRIRQKNGQLRLANIKPQIFEVFVITKLNKLFRILPSRQEALASFM